MPHVKNRALWHFVWTTYDRMPCIKPENCFFRWQSGYAIFGVSPSHKFRVTAYIQNQEEHHRNGSLWFEAEPDDDDPTA